MRRLPLLLWAVFAVVGCSQAQPRVQASTPVTPQHVQAPDSAIAQSLIAQGGAALRAERWAEAERYFASAYEGAAESQRGEAAYLWGFALFRQGEAIARSNPMGEEEAERRARQYFEEARAVLRRAEHPLLEHVLKAIGQFLGPLIADGRS